MLMDGITIVFAVVAALLVFAIAAAVVGREAHRLDAVAPRAVYQLDEAVDFVCDRLPEASQARLTPGEVEQLLVHPLALPAGLANVQLERLELVALRAQSPREAPPR